jgi:hypothetical protein
MMLYYSRPARSPAGKRLHFRDCLSHRRVVDLAHVDRFADILQHGEEQFTADVLAEFFQAVEKTRVDEEWMCKDSPGQARAASAALIEMKQLKDHVHVAVERQTRSV